MDRDKKRGTYVQYLIADDMFNNQLGEMQIRKKYNLTPNAYKDLFESPGFIQELEFKMESAKRESRMIVARCMPLAAVKLIELTESDKPETARKACLDIIETVTKLLASPKDEKSGKNADIKPESLEVPPDVASELLSVLAKKGG